MMRLYQLTALIAFLAILISFGGAGAEEASAAPNDVISFADASLENAIRHTLNKTDGDITRQELEDMTELDASFHEIKFLGGLEHAVNLTSLNLYGNQITDVTALSSLTKLEELSIGNNQISNIGALTNLVQLKSLVLNQNQVEDISVLSRMTKLESLWLSYNKVSDIRPLANLTQLETLMLNHNAIIDIGSLSSLKKLTGLNISGNEIENIAAIGALTGLSWLNVENNPINKLDVLRSLAKLNYVTIGGTNDIRDISALQNMSDLRYVTHRGNALGASDKAVIQALMNRGIAVEYMLVIPPGYYIYDVNMDGIVDSQDINAAINYYMQVKPVSAEHPELKILDRELDPSGVLQPYYIYDTNLDGEANADDINAIINFYMNLDDVATLHPEFKITVAN